MPVPSPRHLAALAAALLLIPAAASAKKGEDGHPGRAHGTEKPVPDVVTGPPPHAQGRPPVFAPVESEAPAGPPAEDPGDATATTTTTTSAPPAAVPPAARARADEARVRGRGRAKRVAVVLVGTVLGHEEGTLRVAVTGGNRRGRDLGLEELVVERADRVTLDDEAAQLGDVPEGARLVIQMRLRRGEAPSGAVRRVAAISPAPVTEPEPEPTPAPAPVNEPEPTPAAGEEPV